MIRQACLALTQFQIDLGSDDAGFFVIVAGLLMWATAIVHIFLAVRVFRDASEGPRGQPALFLPPILWGLVVVAGGLVSTAIYWAMHHSTLRRDGE